MPSRISLVTSAGPAKGTFPDTKDGVVAAMKAAQILANSTGERVNMVRVAVKAKKPKAKKASPRRRAPKRAKAHAKKTKKGKRRA